MCCLLLPGQVEDHAAKAHDVMAIRCRGTDTVLNFVAESYSELLPLLLPEGGRRPLHRVRGICGAGRVKPGIGPL